MGIGTRTAAAGMGTRAAGGPAPDGAVLGSVPEHSTVHPGSPGAAAGIGTRAAYGSDEEVEFTSIAQMLAKADAMPTLRKRRILLPPERRVSVRADEEDACPLPPWRRVSARRSS